MTRNAAIMIALVVLAISGLAHGFWSERWAPSAVLQEAAARVDQVPMEIGLWKAQTIPEDPAIFYQTGAQRFWTRSYVHTQKKTAFLVILMCGRAGRMAVHTPEVCYRGAGYELEGEPKVVAVKAAGADLGTLWMARFAKGTGGGMDLRLFWGWNAGGLWQAAVNPRWEYGGEAFLYKLYIAQDGPRHANLSTETAQEFLGQFLPELHRILLLKGS